MYRIRFLPAVAADRAAIREYLNQYGEDTAQRFFALLRGRTTQLKRFPFSCPPYEDDPDYRVMTVGDYLVFYMVTAKTVEIHRIFHHTRDISRHLKAG